MISVSDNGWGVDKKYQKKLFSPFFRVPRENSTIKGYGIGLSQVRRIIKKHGGNISINSELGRGTEFTILIPIRK